MMPEKKRIELETLLRLKRLERPAPEFWDGFDRELRAKQLAALVEKRPWWRDFSARFAGFRRYHLPIGATAILAMTFVAVRDYQPDGVESTVRVAPQAERGERSDRDQRALVSTDANVASNAHAESDRLARSEIDAAAADVPQDIESAVDLNAGEATVARVPVLWASGSGDEQMTPSARSIAANLAAAEAAEPAVVRRLLGLRHGFEAGASTLEAAVEPLQQMSSPSEARLARFDSPMARTALLSAPSRGDERVARDIDVYERAARRIGGGGDRFIVKF